MFGTFIFPDLPSMALAQSLGLTSVVIVHERGKVISPHAMRGMTAERAHALAPEAPVLVRQTSLEDAAWDAIVEQVFNVTPYLTVSSRRITAEFENPTTQLLDPSPSSPSIPRFLDSSIPPSGFASTPTLSLLAAISSLERGETVVVEDGEEAEFLESLPVQALLELPELGLDERMIKKLELFGLGTVGRLRLLTLTQIRAQFGDAGGALWSFLSSIPTSLTSFEPGTRIMYQLPPVITEQERFFDAVREAGHFEILAKRICTRASEQLTEGVGGNLEIRNSGPWKTSRIEVSLLDKADRPMRTASRILRAPTCDTRRITTQVQAMLESLVGTDVWAWGVQVKLASLTRPKAEQLTLLEGSKAHGLANSAVQSALVKRFPRAIKKIDIIDPWAYTPDRFAILSQWTLSGKLSAVY